MEVSTEHPAIKRMMDIIVSTNRTVLVISLLSYGTSRENASVKSPYTGSSLLLFQYSQSTDRLYVPDKTCSLQDNPAGKQIHYRFLHSLLQNFMRIAGYSLITTYALKHTHYSFRHGMTQHTYARVVSFSSSYQSLRNLSCFSRQAGSHGNNYIKPLPRPAFMHTALLRAASLKEKNTNFIIGQLPLSLKSHRLHYFLVRLHQARKAPHHRCRPLRGNYQKKRYRNQEFHKSYHRLMCH